LKRDNLLMGESPKHVQEIMSDNLRKAGWRCGCISNTDHDGRNFGLWPESARTLDALLCMQIKSCLPFSNSNPQLKPAGHNHECDCPKLDEILGDYR
jgi:hypothetical protein